MEIKPMSHAIHSSHSACPSIPFFIAFIHLMHAHVLYSVHSLLSCGPIIIFIPFLQSCISCIEWPMLYIYLMLIYSFSIYAFKHICMTTYKKTSTQHRRHRWQCLTYRKRSTCVTHITRHFREPPTLLRDPTNRDAPERDFDNSQKNARSEGQLGHNTRY